MDYSFFFRGALDLGTRAVRAYERHVTVAEDRLAWDRDRPVFDEGILPSEHGPHDDPPPPPEAADGFSFHMPAAGDEAAGPSDDAPLKGVWFSKKDLMEAVGYMDPASITFLTDGDRLVLSGRATGLMKAALSKADPGAPEVTDLQRAQAEVLVERAKREALERQVAELKAAKRPSGIVRELAEVLDGRGTVGAARSRDVRAAVSSFQAALGLREDGIVGPQTLLAMAGVYAGAQY